VKGFETTGPQASEPAWLWRGTQGSADKGLISLLALIETLVATAVSASIALHYGTHYLLVSACIAPLLLLRTPASQELGLRWGLQVVHWAWDRILILFDKLPDPSIKRIKRIHPVLRLPLHTVILVPGIILSISGLTTSALLTLGVRFLATFVAFCKTPFRCLEAIPVNWWRNIACIDMTHMPEPLPGLEQAIDAPEFSKFRNAYMLHPGRTLKLILGKARDEDEDSFTLWILQWLTAALFILLIALPAWLYRWSLKGTFLLYSPLVWVAHRSFTDNPWDRLMDLRELAFYRLIRRYSVLVLVLLLARGVLDILIPTWPSLWAGLPSAAILDAVLAPHSLPFWQLAMGINALTAWALYFFADWALKRHERGRPPHEHGLDGILRALWLVRTSLSVYVIGNGIHAAVVLARVLPA
jgi:hypothetical protein